jgi:hypothetical protein
MAWFCVLSKKILPGVYACRSTTGTNFVPPNANKVLIDELVDFINTNPLQLNDIELATVFITN